MRTQDEGGSYTFKGKPALLPLHLQGSFVFMLHLASVILTPLT